MICYKSCCASLFRYAEGDQGGETYEVMEGGGPVQRDRTGSTYNGFEAERPASVEHLMKSRPISAISGVYEMPDGKAPVLATDTGEYAHMAHSNGKQPCL